MRPSKFRASPLLGAPARSPSDKRALHECDWRRYSARRIEHCTGSRKRHFGKTRAEWQPLMSKLIEAGVLENELYDVHDVRGDNPESMPPIGLFESVASETGLSSMRLADVNGKHEWIAGYEKDGFQFGKYSQQQVSIFHACDAQVILDTPTECLSREDCELMDSLESMSDCPHIGLD